MRSYYLNSHYFDLLFSYCYAFSHCSLLTIVNNSHCTATAICNCFLQVRGFAQSEGQVLVHQISNKLLVTLPINHIDMSSYSLTDHLSQRVSSTSNDAPLPPSPFLLDCCSPFLAPFHLGGFSKYHFDIEKTKILEAGFLLSS